MSLSLLDLFRCLKGRYPFNQKEFMGKFYVKPKINNISNPPELKWFASK